MRQVGSLAELDLDQVFGLPLSPQVATELIALDARLSRLERSSRRPGWIVGHGERDVLPGQPLPVVLDRTLSFPTAADDLLELAVDVWQQDAATLLVDATVEVYCFCLVNHNVHRAAEREWIARTDTELRDGLASAVAAVEEWAELDLTAEDWRARAGLPGRR